MVLEALVVFFALLVAVSLSDVDAGLAVAVGATLSALCVLTAGLLRFRWALVVGSVLQVLIVVTGLVVPLMFFLGTVFAGFWVAALVLGRKADRSIAGHG